MGSLATSLAFSLGGSSVAGGPRVESCDVWAHDLIAVFFNEPIANNANLSSVSNYTITPTGAGQGVVVREVLPTNFINPEVIYLVISPFTVGAEYLVTVGTSIRDVTAATMNDVFRSAKFIGRDTKIDSVIRSRPTLYDMSPKTLIRNLHNAVARSDDMIGGSRNDSLPLTAQSLVNVAVTPKFVTLPVTTVQLFSATVTGATSVTVTWEVNGILGGNATVGTITGGGAYTAPLVVPAHPLINITARSSANNTRVDIAYALITP